VEAFDEGAVMKANPLLIAVRIIVVPIIYIAAGVLFLAHSAGWGFKQAVKVWRYNTQ